MTVHISPNSKMQEVVVVGIHLYTLYRCACEQIMTCCSGSTYLALCRNPQPPRFLVPAWQADMRDQSQTKYMPHKLRLRTQSIRHDLHENHSSFKKWQNFRQILVIGSLNKESKMHLKHMGQACWLTGWPTAYATTRSPRAGKRFDFDWFVFYWKWIYMKVLPCFLPEATKRIAFILGKKTTIPKRKDLKLLKSWVVYSTKRSLTSSKSSPEAFSCPKINDSTNGVTLLRFEQIGWKNILHQIQQTQYEQMFRQVSGNTCSEMVCFQVRAQNEGSSKIEHFGGLYWVSRNLRHPQMHVDIKPLSFVQQLTFHAPWELPKCKLATGFSHTVSIRWLVVSTQLKNISQNGNHPQVGVKKKTFETTT